MAYARKDDGGPKRPRGRPPKDREETEALPEWDGEVRGPALPRGVGWCKATTEWWTAYRTSPQAMLMSETDWHNMKTAAIIHNRIYQDYGQSLSPTALKSLSEELRKITDTIGGSFESRKNLNVSVRSPKDAHNEMTEFIETEVGEAVDYMSRLAKRQAEATKTRPE